MTEFETRSPDETRELGMRIAKVIQAGDTLAFEGELGSGKTTIIQGIIRGLGVDDRVQSPSFTLVRTYRARFQIKHVDLFRLQGAEVDALHLEEIYDEDGVMLVEWADHAFWLPGLVSNVEIRFLPADPDRRLLFITGAIEARLG